MIMGRVYSFIKCMSRGLLISGRMPHARLMDDEYLASTSGRHALSHTHNSGDDSPCSLGIFRHCNNSRRLVVGDDNSHTEQQSESEWDQRYSCYSFRKGWRHLMTNTFDKFFHLKRDYVGSA